MKKKILIVEDEQPLNEAYKAILAREGYKIAQAFDGTEALTHVKKDKFDLILLDLRMPKMNGIEFLKEYNVKNQPDAPRIIVFSNLDMQKEIDEAFELGADKYMLKAWASPKDLVKLVRENIKK